MLKNEGWYWYFGIMALSVRIHTCPNCGFSIDRDLNATFNILNRYKQKIVGGDTAELRTPVEILPLLPSNGGSK